MRIFSVASAFFVIGLGKGTARAPPRQLVGVFYGPHRRMSPIPYPLEEVLRQFVPDGVTQWISGVHEDTWYKRLALIEVAEGRVEPTSTSRTPWIPELWQRVAATGRKKKENRILGFGEHGAELLGLPTSRRGASEFISSSSTMLTPSDQIQMVVNASLAEERQRAQQREETLRAEIRRLQEERQTNARCNQETQNMMQMIQRQQQPQERSQSQPLLRHQQFQIGSDFMNLLQQEDYNPDMTNI